MHYILLFRYVDASSAISGVIITLHAFLGLPSAYHMYIYCWDHSQVHNAIQGLPLHTCLMYPLPTAAVASVSLIGRDNTHPPIRRCIQTASVVTS